MRYTTTSSYSLTTNHVLTSREDDPFEGPTGGLCHRALRMVGTMKGAPDVWQWTADLKAVLHAARTTGNRSACKLCEKAVIAEIEREEAVAVVEEMINGKRGAEPQPDRNVTPRAAVSRPTCVGCGQTDVDYYETYKGRTFCTSCADPDGPEPQAAPVPCATCGLDSPRHRFKCPHEQNRIRRIQRQRLGLPASPSTGAECWTPPVCVACGSGNVAYRNFKDQPFCWTCADGAETCGDCGIAVHDDFKSGDAFQRLCKTCHNAAANNRTTADGATPPTSDELVREADAAMAEAGVSELQDAREWLLARLRVVDDALAAATPPLITISVRANLQGADRLFVRSGTLTGLLAFDESGRWSARRLAGKYQSLGHHRTVAEAVARWARITGVTGPEDCVEVELMPTTETPLDDRGRILVVVGGDIWRVGSRKDGRIGGVAYVEAQRLGDGRWRRGWANDPKGSTGRTLWDARRTFDLG